ncbi:MAG: MlaD family protein, partial [Flavobacteriales bacterium]
MKLRKEFLIGIIVIIISIAMFYTIRFIQGSNLFSDSIIVHASYPKINNLQVGNPIYINGLKIGLITDTRISNDSDAHIDVDLTLETKYPIPNDSKAEIMELGLMGSMAMDIVLGKSKTPLVNGDRIHASIRSGMM